MKYMDIAEFRDGGYLLEVNRRFFHPLGLALECTQEDDGSQRLSGIQDHRDDPEGIIYGDLVPADQERAQRVRELATARAPLRAKYGCDENGVEVLFRSPNVDAVGDC